MRPQTALRLIKALHTMVWAVFAGTIIAIPVFAQRGAHATAWGLIGFVMLEVGVLAMNHMRCPLTDIAAHYTLDRRANFDIYLPRWLARHNKVIFGTLYVAGIAYAAWAWKTGPSPFA